MELRANTIIDRLAHALGLAHQHAKDHFIPHEGNDHVPHLLKHRVLFGYSAIVVLLKVLVVVIPVALPSVSLYSSSITVKNVIELTNATREKLGLGQLKEESRLNAAADAKVKDMMTNGYFAHTSPAGVTAWTFIKQSGYAYQKAGENLALHYTTAEGLHDGWMASPTHKANIVNEAYGDIGVGIIQGLYGGYNTTMVVQIFGKPATTAPAPAAVATAPVVTPAPAPAAPAPQPVPAVPATEKTDEEEPAVVAGSTDTVAEPKQTEPVAPTIVVEPQAPPLALDESTVLIVPGANEYHVDAAVAGAASVTLTLGANTAPLTATPEGRWAGSIAYAAEILPENGADLFLFASGTDGQALHAPIAMVAPDARTQDVYAFGNGNKTAVIAGINVENLDDDVRRFYLYTVIFLIGGMLISLLYRLHLKRLSVVAHTMVVILITTVLLNI